MASTSGTSVLRPSRKRVPTMLKLTLSTLRARKARFALTAAAVALGVAFMAGTLVLTATLSNAYQAISGQALEGTDALVRSAQVVTDSNGTEIRSSIDDTVLATVRAVPTVAAAEPRIEGIAQILGDDGELLDDNANRAPPVAMAWSDDAEVSPLELVAGHAPTAAAEIVIDRSSAEAGSFVVGDPVRVVTPTGSGTYSLAGIATYGGADDAAGAAVIAFPPATASQVIGEPGRYDAISVRAAEGVSQAELAEDLGDALAGSTGVEAITGDQAVDEAEAASATGVAFMNTFLMAFAVTALLVGSFVISNTFSITVAQRSKETAMLRAIGASRRQVKRAMWIEALLTGITASALGVVLGIGAATGLRALLAGFGLDLPDGGLVVTTGTIVTCMAVGTLVTVVAAVVPARKAAKVAPIAAMRDVAVDHSGRSAKRAVIGVAVTAVGVALLALGLAGAGVPAVGLGAIVVFVGVAVLGPVIAQPVSRVLGAPLARFRGMTGTMARENAIRNPKRTSATASALMVGVGLVVFITVFAASARTSIANSVDTAMRGDWFVETTFGQGGLAPSVGESIASLPEVGAMSPLRYSAAVVDGTAADVSAFDPAQIDAVADLAVTDGSVAGMGSDEVAIQTEVAEGEGLAVGDRTRIEFPETGSQAFTVAAVYDTVEPLGAYAMSLDAFEANGVDAVDAFLIIANADGVSMDEARAAIEARLDGYPTARLLTADEFTQSKAGEINQMLNLIYALLALAVVIALFGLANTLTLSVHERTRELGLLRAVGMARSQVRAVVRWESVIIALLGTTIGSVVGLGFGWAMVRSLADQGFEQLTLPVGQLTAIVVLAALAGVAAAVLPARRAARVEVLTALHAS